MTAITVGTYAGLVGFCVSGSFLSQGFLWPIYIITSIGIAIVNFMDNHYPEPEPELKNEEGAADKKGKSAKALKRKGTSNAKPVKTLAEKR